MDTNSNQYLPITKCHLFFYSVNSETSKIEFLLYKKNSSSYYSNLHGEILPSDNALLSQYVAKLLQHFQISSLIKQYLNYQNKKNFSLKI